VTSLLVKILTLVLRFYTRERDVLIQYFCDRRFYLSVNLSMHATRVVNPFNLNFYCIHLNFPWDRPLHPIAVAPSHLS